MKPVVSRRADYGGAPGVWQQEHLCISDFCRQWGLPAKLNQLGGARKAGKEFLKIRGLDAEGNDVWLHVRERQRGDEVQCSSKCHSKQQVTRRVPKLALKARSREHKKRKEREEAERIPSYVPVDQSYESDVEENQQPISKLFCCKFRFSYWATEAYQEECAKLGAAG